MGVVSLEVSSSIATSRVLGRVSIGETRRLDKSNSLDGRINGSVRFEEHLCRFSTASGIPAVKVHRRRGGRRVA